MTSFEPFIDLHLHTDHSDGAASVDQLLAIVRSQKLTAWAVTDHDTIEGYLALQPLLKPGDPQLLSGVELSTSIGGRDVHLLAYLFEPYRSSLVHELRSFQEARRERGKKIVEKLNSLKLKLDYSEVEKIAGHGVIGRPHIADALLKRGLVRSLDEAFQRYLSTTGAAYVPKKLFHPREAIKMVHESGGIVVMAHPGLEEAYLFLDELVGFGLDGIEVYHPTLTASDSQRYRALAEKHRLIVSGGSDYHGRNDRHGPVGSQSVPVACLEKMFARAETHRGKS